MTIQQVAKELGLTERELMEVLPDESDIEALEFHLTKIEAEICNIENVPGYPQAGYENALLRRAGVEAMLRKAYARLGPDHGVWADDPIKREAVLRLDRVMADSGFVGAPLFADGLVADPIAWVKVVAKCCWGYAMWDPKQPNAQVFDACADTYKALGGKGDMLS